MAGGKPRGGDAKREEKKGGKIKKWGKKVHFRLCSPRNGQWGSEVRDAEVRGFGSSGVQGFGVRGSGLGQSPRPGWGCGQRSGAARTLGRLIPSALPAPREGGKKGRRKNKSEEAKSPRHREGREGGRRQQGTARRGNRRSSCSSAPPLARPPRRAAPSRPAPSDGDRPAPLPRRAAPEPPGGTRGEGQRGEHHLRGRVELLCRHLPASPWGLRPQMTVVGAPSHPRGVNTQSHGTVFSMSPLGLGQTARDGSPVPSPAHADGCYSPACAQCRGWEWAAGNRTAQCPIYTAGAYVRLPLK